MQSELELCEAHALKLAPKDRAILAQHLISSLDTLESGENERLWVEEAQCRYTAFKDGAISSRLASEVIDSARKAIQ